MGDWLLPDENNLSGSDDSDFMFELQSDPYYDFWLWEREVDRDLNEDLTKMAEYYESGRP